MIVCRRMKNLCLKCCEPIDGNASGRLQALSSRLCKETPFTPVKNSIKQFALVNTFNQSLLSKVHLPTSSRALDHWRCMSTAEKMAGVDVLRHLHDPESLSYLSQSEATAIDEELMGPLGFSIDQLMELAGLSVASAIFEVYDVQKYKRVLVICGPGNNGGDGLVASRHLFLFGYRPAIFYPKRTDKPIYKVHRWGGLAWVREVQLETFSTPFLTEDMLSSESLKSYDLIVDAIFGFSFHGKARPPFDRLLQQLADISTTLTPPIPIVSVDIPSGWDVELGDKDGLAIKPDMLVSLTAPKLCAKMFKGSHHYLGGRFVPTVVVEKYNLKLPPYPGSSLCVRIGKPPSVDVAALRENYVGAVLLEEQVNVDPFKQFQEWFEDAVAAGLTEPNAMTLATANTKGHPSARMVLLKGYDNRGFLWYTNYGSRKASELLPNPWASLVFFWDKLHRQFRALVVGA
ncbi:hypothetical protein L7F22_002582 [Adiantum nelumboides]|nr:hypothetical protein [Adiantum nelumboides]